MCLFKPPRERNFTFSQVKYGRHASEYNKGGSNKFVHYVSDGTGRDFYVGSNEGGNSNVYRWRNQTEHYFRNTLRNSKPLPNVLFHLFSWILKMSIPIWKPRQNSLEPIKSFIELCRPSRASSPGDFQSIKNIKALLQWIPISGKDLIQLANSERKNME